MRSFQFRLERVLEWRKAQLELEEFKLRQLAAELDRLEQARLAVGESRTTARQALFETGPADGSELESLARHLRHLAQLERRLAERKSEQERRMADQHAALLEARRRLRLLERLRERRWTAWRVAADRETEALAAETFLGRFERRD